MRLCLALRAITVSLRLLILLRLTFARSAALSLRLAGPSVTVTLADGERSVITRWPWESASDFALAPFSDTPVSLSFPCTR